MPPGAAERVGHRRQPEHRVRPGPGPGHASDRIQATLDGGVGVSPGERQLREAAGGVGNPPRGTDLPKPRQRAVEVAWCGVEVTLGERDAPQAKVAHRLAECRPVLCGEGQAAFEQDASGVELAADKVGHGSQTDGLRMPRGRQPVAEKVSLIETGQRPGGVAARPRGVRVEDDERPANLRVDVAVQGHLDPPSHLGGPAEVVPVQGDSAEKPRAHLVVTGPEQRPSQGASKVGVLGLHPLGGLRPRPLLHVPDVPLGDPHQPERQSIAHGVLLALVPKLLLGEAADHLEHDHAIAIAAAPQQRRRLEPIHGACRRLGRDGGHLREGGHRDAAGGGPQGSQDAPLVWSQQLIAPRDRGGHGPVALVSRRSAGVEHRKAALQILLQLAEAEIAGPPRRELDRQREAVETTTDIGDTLEVGGHRRPAPHRPAAFDEQGHRGTRSPIVFVDGEGVHDELVFPVDVEARPAGAEAGQIGAVLEELDDHLAGPRQLLEVVEDRQLRLAPEPCPQAIASGPFGDAGDGVGRGEQFEDLGGLGLGGQGHERRADVVLARDPSSHLDGDPSLSHPRRSGDRHQAGRPARDREQSGEIGHLSIPAEQIRERRGQRNGGRRIGGRVEAARRGPRSRRRHEAAPLVGADAEHVREPLGHCPRWSTLPRLDLADGDRRAANQLAQLLLGEIEPSAPSAHPHAEGNCGRHRNERLPRPALVEVAIWASDGERSGPISATWPAGVLTLTILQPELGTIDLFREPRSALPLPQTDPALEFSIS